jgi:hypothetical protein
MRVVGAGAAAPTVGVVRGASARVASELRGNARGRGYRVYGEGGHLTVVLGGGGGGGVAVDARKARVHLVHAAAGIGVASVAADVWPLDKEWQDAVAALQHLHFEHRRRLMHTFGAACQVAQGTE